MDEQFTKKMREEILSLQVQSSAPSKSDFDSALVQVVYMGVVYQCLIMCGFLYICFLVVSYVLHPLCFAEQAQRAID